MKSIMCCAVRERKSLPPLERTKQIAAVAVVKLIVYMHPDRKQRSIHCRQTGDKDKFERLFKD